MTYHQCSECLGDGGWFDADGRNVNCPECYGWGNVDDGESDYEADAYDDATDSVIQYGY